MTSWPARNRSHHGDNQKAPSTIRCIKRPSAISIEYDTSPIELESTERYKAH